MLDCHGRFVWYALITSDVVAAKAFYTEVMGWGVEDASGPGSPYVVFTAAGVPVGGLMDLPKGAISMGAKPIWIGYVGVDDVDAAAHRIGRLGGTLYVPPTEIPNSSRYAVFADPQEATLALFKWLEPGKELAAEFGAPGRVSWHELLAADREQALLFYGELFGWQKAETNIGEMGTYQLFSVGDETIGAVLTKPGTAPLPFWLYYFSIGDIDAAARRVEAAGGHVLIEPFEVSDDRWIVQCTDPQGAIFALEGTRGRNPPGYFERFASHEVSARERRRWNW